MISFLKRLLGRNKTTDPWFVPVNPDLDEVPDHQHVVTRTDTVLPDPTRAEEMLTEPRHDQMLPQPKPERSDYDSLSPRSGIKNLTGAIDPTEADPFLVDGDLGPLPPLNDPGPLYTPTTKE